MGFLSYIYVVNSLISMYGKCGSITEAEEVFQRGANARDLVTWNAMLSAYIDLGENQKALQLFRQLHNEGINPDARTFIMGLLACHNNKEHVEVGEKVFSEEFSFDIGECIHAGAKKNCVLSNDFFLSTLIIMYGKCKSCARAENVFCSIGNPDIVQWNSMLTAYIELGLAVKTLQAFVQLNKEAKIPDQHTFVLALQACCLLAEEGIPFIQLGYAKLMALEIGEALLHDAWKQGYASNSFLNTAMISLYGKCGIIEKAEAIFSQVDRQRVTTWNAVLSTYIELGKGEKALQLYSTMQKEGVSPDSVTFVVAIQACCIILEKENASRLSSSVSLEIGKALHMDAEREGLDTKEFVGNTLLHMYGKCGAIDDAEKIFGQLPQYNIILWNTMLSVLAEQGLADKASILFLQMQETGILMNEGTLISILQASSVAGWMDLCMKIHFIIVAEGYDTYSTLITTLIHTYGNCASIADAKTAFSGLCQYDLISCSAYLDSLVQTCHFDACLEAFEFMRRIGLEPDGVTFYSLLSGCSHAGTVDIGIQCFEFLIRECCILPESRHYAIMLDLLGRAGDFRRLKNLLVTKNADLDMWFSLLGVCSVHGNVEMGKWAFDKILHMNPKDASAYILMWNIFTNAGMEESANEIDFLRQREGLDKVCLE
ncbi:hypothetical protein KP509_32G031800 [Ceratopteris richardii]|nr:hypothetical protein KP509_32G031800 [Ceratopteris richardii]